MSLQYTKIHEVTGYTPGTDEDIPFTFEYLDDGDIKVYKTDTSEAPLIYGTDWVFKNRQEITLLNSSPNFTIANSDVFQVQRETEVGTAYITYAPGSPVRAEDLNNNQKQALYSAQEREDRAINKNGESDVTGRILFRDNVLGFEGVTSNDYETFFAAVDPTQDNTITLPDITGTVITDADTGTVSRQMIANDAINGDKIEDDAVDSEHIAAGAVDLEHMSANSVDSDQYVDGSIDTIHIDDDQVTYAKMQDISTDLRLLGRNNASDGTVSEVQIATGMVVDDAITDAKLADSSTDDADRAVGTNHIKDSAVTSAKIADGTIVNDDVNANANIAGSKLADDSVDLDKLSNTDVIETTNYSSAWATDDTKIATVGALEARHDLVVNTNVTPPTTTQTGKQWLSIAPGNQVHKIYDGSGWRTVAVGQPYSPATTTVVRYVDVTNGSDASDVTGFLPQAPLQSIERALELVNASATGDGTLIKVAPGVYQETLPLRIKKNNVSIVGESMRSCFVHPTVATENNDMFEVDSGSYIANLTLLGLKVPTADQGTRNNTLDNDATYGLPSNQPFSVRFRTDVQPVILKSPYIQNCTHFSDAHFDNASFDPNTFPSTDGQTYSAVAGDGSSAPCGGGLLVDGAAVSSSSPIRSMVVDAFTQITLDGPGVLVTNNGYAQLVSFFGTFAHYHAKAKNGGQINLSNCVSDFGRYGLIADGKSPSAIATATASAANSGATTITVGAITTAGSFHGTVTRPLDHMMVTIDGVDYGVVSSTANGAGWDIVLTTGLTSNITNTTVEFALRSYISTGGHTFEFVGVGTDYGDHPDNGGVPVEANQVVELNGGKVWQSSTDHVGKFKAGNVLVVDQVSENVALKDTTVTGNLAVTGNVDGRDVSTDGTKLDTIATGAEVNVQSDWNATSGDAFIANKPTIPSGDVVDDASPQLGGNLDVQNYEINTSTSNGNITLTPNGTGFVEIKGDGSSNDGTLQLNCSQNSHGVKIKSPPHSANASYTLTLPTTDGNANEVLQTDGAGVLSWVAQTSGYTDNNVDTHLNTGAASSGEVLSWTGSDYDWVAQSGGGGITVQDEGTTLSTTATTLNFVGSGVTAAGTGATKTITISGGGGGASDIDGLSDGYTDSTNNIFGLGATSYGATSTNNLMIGLDTGTGALTSNNTLIGIGVGNNLTSAYNSVGIGNNVFGSITGAVSLDVAIGHNAMANTSSTQYTGYHNVAIGGHAMETLGSSAIGNVAVGLKTGASTTSGDYNVYIGWWAGSDGTTAWGNQAIGRSAGYSLTTGDSNSIMGDQAGYYLTSGDDNVFIGSYAGYRCTTSGENTFVGHEAGMSEMGQHNTYIGNQAGPDAGAVDNNDNTAVGHFALHNVANNANRNTAIGYNAGMGVSTGTNNTFLGESTGNVSSGDRNIVIGSNATASSSTVNDEITIGSTTTTRLRLPGLQASASNGDVLTYNSTNGLIELSAPAGGGGISDTSSGSYSLGAGDQSLANETSSGSSNTAFGDYALNQETSGDGNTAIGMSSAQQQNGGSDNTVIGYGARLSATGGSGNVMIGKSAGYSQGNTSSYNIAIGAEAGYVNTSGGTIFIGYQSGRYKNGGSNTACGYQSQYSNSGTVSTNTSYRNTSFGSYALRLVEGSLSIDNSAFGANALQTLDTGTKNNAFGVSALNDCTAGANNDAFGVGALQNVTVGDDNVGMGYNSLATLTSGDHNVAIGTEALTSLNTVGQCVGVGYRAGFYNTSNNNTYLGYQAGGTSVSTAHATGQNTTALGYMALPSSTGVSNEITLGNSSVATLRCNVQTISSLSDGRDKTEVEDLPLGLEFINTLRPVKFKWDTRDGNGKDGSYDAGFIAQDLQSAQSTSNAEYLNMVMDENPDRLEARYGQLIPVLVQAIKDLKSEIDELKANV